jgi:hypothetical protein
MHKRREKGVIPVGRKLNRLNIFKVAAACGIVSIFLFGSAEAQDLDPRRYVNLPVNQNFARLAYGYSKGDVNTSESLPLEDAVLTIHGGSLAYLRSMSIGGKASSIDVWLPLMCASGSHVVDGERRTRDVCGQGDATIRMTYNFVGAAAMSLSEFVKKEKEVVVGASLQVYIPTGQYDDDLLLNIGANRWVIKPEIGMSIPWHKWSFEFSAGVRFFFDNDKFLGNVLLEQDPLYNVQAHIIYVLSPRQWISLDANYFFGGITFQDAIETPTEQQNSRVGVNWAVALNAKQLLRFAGHWGVITSVGNDSDTYTMAWTYRWD